MATILAAAGVQADADYPLDGINLLPICQGKTPLQARTLAWRTFQRTRHKALRSGEWKYLHDGNQEYLFHLEEDPGEQRDLKTRHPARFKALKAQYQQWEARMLQPVALP
jgi:arylsulfatase A-like enzyme